VTDSVLFGIVCIAAISFVLSAMLYERSRSLAKLVSYIEHDAIRHDQQIERLLDRLTTIRWEDFAALTSIQDKDEQGGFLTPEEQATEANQEVSVTEPGRWGPLSRASRANSLTMQEQQLLDEDFPPENRAP
jgi:hypothetical protein